MLPAERFGPVSRWLHGLIALVMLGLIALGWWMVGLGYYDAWYHRSLELHRAIGVTAMALALVFPGEFRPHVGAAWAPLHWVLGLASYGLFGVAVLLKPWERRAARVVHGILLGAMIAIPATGYLVSTSEGAGFGFFGLFDVPALVPASEALRDVSIDLHFYMAYGLIGLVALHAAAALKHQFIDGHGTLRRMV